MAVLLDNVFEDTSAEYEAMQGWASVAALGMAAGGRGGLPLPKWDLRVLLRCAVDENWHGLPKTRCLR